MIVLREMGVPLAGPVREQPHFVLGPQSTCHGRGPCGAKRGAPFAATRERALWISRRHIKGQNGAHRAVHVAYLRNAR